MSGSTWTWIGGTINVDNSIDWSLTGGAGNAQDIPEAGDTSINNGTLTGIGTIAAPLVNNGTVEVSNNGNPASSTGGELQIQGAVSGTGSMTIEPGATLWVTGALGSGQTIVFSPGAPETLILGAPTGTITNPISGFAAGDRIEFSNGITINSDFAAVPAGTTLTVSYHDAGGTSTYLLPNVAFSGDGPLSYLTQTDFATGAPDLTLTTFMTWVGASGASFSAPSSWNFGTIVPSVQNFVTFNNSAGGTIGGTGTVQGFNFNNGGTWSLASGATVVSASALNIGNANGGTSSAASLVIGPGSTILSEGNLNVGSNSGNVSSLTITGGGVLDETAPGGPNAAMEVANAAASGTLAAASGNVLVTGTGSMLNLGANALYIANAGGSGTVTVSQGGSIIAAAFNDNTLDPLSIGYHGNGTLIVTDPGSQFTANGIAYLAHVGTGTLTVENHGSVLISPDPVGLVGLIVGNGNQNGVGGSGLTTVTTDGVLTDQGYLTVGQRGTEGQLSVLNGGTVQVGTTLYVGEGGTITTAGSIAAGTTETASGTLTIGAGSTVELTGAPQTASYGVYVSNSNASAATPESGFATVSGTGALLNANGNGLAVAQFGTGDLTVSQGGSVASGTPNTNLIAALAVARQGSGTVTVTGAGSQLTADGGSYIAKGGDGTLLVENLGSVVIGLDGVGNGGLTVGGGGTNSTGTLWSGGTGTLQVTSGGALSSLSYLDIGNDGGTGTLNVTGGTVTATGRMLIGDSTTLSPGATIISPTGTTAVTSATIETGTGAVTVGTGGVLSIDQSGTTATAIVLGDAVGSTGALTATGGGTVTAGGGVSLVRNATVSVTAGGGVSANGIDEATSAGGSDAIAVSGTKSLLSTTGSFTVGDAGLGSLSVGLGGTVSAASLLVANAASSSGSSADVSGTGSQLEVSGLLLLGAAASGSLQLDSGASATVGSLDAAQSAAAVADISVSGAGTDFTVTGSATVADDGTGVLSVLDGASFSAQSLTIGNQTDSSGALIVSGDNTTLTVSGSLNIGTALGTGDLTVGPGAVVNASVVNLQGGVVLEGGVLDPTVFIENGGSTTGGFGTVSSQFILLEGTILSNGSKSGKETEVVQGTVVGGGTATINGTVSVNGPGILQIGTHDTIELTSAVLNAATTTFTDNLTPTGTYTVNNSVIDVVFQDTTGVLQLDDIAQFAGTVATWKGGDQFVITGGTLSNIGVANGNTLTFSDAGTGAGAGGVDSIIFSSTISAGSFGIVNGNTVQAVACFAEGTRIRTPNGDVPVEHLHVGDHVLTADGAREPIVWLGQRAIDCHAHPAPETVWPVRVRAGAFSRNVPERDLYLSPDHAVFVNGVLVPVKLLTNGEGIAQTPRDHVRYFHVELPRHAIVLAEGLPVESYLDTGDRANFANDTIIRLFPDFAGRDTAAIWETRGAAPLVLSGLGLDATRRATGGCAMGG